MNPGEVLQHVPWWGWLLSYAVYYVFSNAVASLDAPTEKSSPQYRFWFRFLNRLAANWERAKLWNRGA